MKGERIQGLRTPGLWIGEVWTGGHESVRFTERTSRLQLLRDSVHVPYANDNEVIDRAGLRGSPLVLIGWLEIPLVVIVTPGSGYRSGSTE